MDEKVDGRVEGEQDVGDAVDQSHEVLRVVGVVSGREEPL